MKLKDGLLLAIQTSAPYEGIYDTWIYDDSALALEQFKTDNSGDYVEVWLLKTNHDFWTNVTERSIETPSILTLQNFNGLIYEAKKRLTKGIK